MNFITIDFETANSKRSSACSLGLTCVENGNIVWVKSYLIKPTPNYYESRNTSIHGLTRKDTDESPLFSEIWPEIKELIDGCILVAHNAAFDMDVLRNILDHYHLEHPNIEYFCTYQLSKGLIRGLVNYRLETVCEHLGIELANHHDAECDSSAAAKIVLCLIHKFGYSDLNTLLLSLDIKLRTLEVVKEKRAILKHENAKHSTFDFDVDSIVIDSETPFFGKNVLFTGTLKSMSRENAQTLIEQLGGINLKSFNKSINFLVCGSFETLKNETSGKYQKAMKLIDSGGDVEILDEDTLLDYLSHRTIQYFFNVESFTEGNAYLLKRNLYGEFCRKRLAFSETLLSDLSFCAKLYSGEICHKDDLNTANIVILSSDDFELLQNGIKPSIILDIENILATSKDNGDLKYILPITECAYLLHCETRQLYGGTNGMSIHPYEVSEDCKERRIFLSKELK